MNNVSSVHFSSSLNPIGAQSLAKIDSRINKIKQDTLQLICSSMPVPSLFNPQLKIDLGTFIKDQMFIRRIAEFLNSLEEVEVIDKNAIAKRFEDTLLYAEFKALFKNDLDVYLETFYLACVDVLNQKGTNTNTLALAIEGRLFTLKNALIAQHTPSVIQTSQKQHQLKVRPEKDIQEAGASFIRESLSLHLNSLKVAPSNSFRELLTLTVEKLTPFVRSITKAFLEEHGQDCPADPLTFRNPTGYNYQALVAAPVMEAALSVLGYKARLLFRTDLETKVVLTPFHSIVEVTGPDSKYIVDSCYVQFHHDVCLESAAIPSNPALILAENEVDDYVESMMHSWRKIRRLIIEKDPVMFAKVQKENRITTFAIDQLGHYLNFNAATLATLKQIAFLAFADVETWVKKAMKLMWDAKTYSPLLFSPEIQEIFYGSGKSKKTFEMIKPMGIAGLTSYISSEEVKNRLKACLANSSFTNKNSLEAMNLIARLDSDDRDHYTSLLDIDPRLSTYSSLSPTLNAYFRSLKKLVNSEESAKKVLYGCSGADVLSVFLATDAEDYTFVDLTQVSYEEFTQSLEQFKDRSTWPAIFRQLEATKEFLTSRFRWGGSMSTFINEKHHMEKLPLKLIYDLNAMGVDLNKVSISKKNQEVCIEFPWKYHGSTKERNRRITYIMADITQPNTYPVALKYKLAEGIDIFYMKAAFLAPRFYPQFLPQIVESIKEGGWLMTADKMMTMESVNPEDSLKPGVVTFKQTEEKVTLENLMIPPTGLFPTIFVLDNIPATQRWNRGRSSDLSYWSILHLRQKITLNQ